MRRRIRSALFALGIATASVLPGQAQESNPPRATLGFEAAPAPIIRDTLPPPQQPHSKPNALPKINTTAQPTPMAAQNAVLGAPVIDIAEEKPFWTRLSVRSDVGNGVGYTRGFTYLEAMVPLLETNRSLLFSDVRIVNFDQENRWEYNLGGGYRWCSPALNRIVGVNAFYDARKTDYHYFQQLGTGLEVLSPNLEFRANGYVIIGAGHREIGDTGFVNQGITNGNFVTQRTQTLEVARGGGEIELGGRLPFLEQFVPRAYLGLYTYSAEGAQTANGVRGRLEAQVGRRVSAHFSLQHDRVYETTVTGGLAVHFGAPAYRAGTGRPTWEDVLRQRVVRDVNIVISQESATTQQLTPVPPPSIPASSPIN